MYLVDYVRFSNIQYLPKFHLLQYRALTTAKFTSWMQWNGLNNFEATTWQKLSVLISKEWPRHCQAACQQTLSQIHNVRIAKNFQKCSIMEKTTTTFRTGSAAEFFNYDATTLCSVCTATCQYRSNRSWAMAEKQALLCGQYCSWYTFQTGCKMEKSRCFEQGQFVNAELVMQYTSTFSRSSS